MKSNQKRRGRAKVKVEHHLWGTVVDNGMVKMVTNAPRLLWTLVLPNETYIVRTK